LPAHSLLLFLPVLTGIKLFTTKDPAMILRTDKLPPDLPERPEINYPCTWVYKVIGENSTLLHDIIVAACAPLPVLVTPSHTSSKGKYHSLNAELLIPDESSRLKIYESLKNNPAVKIVL
jgi:putative lipoic acid-binding regulatory protein